MELEEERSWSPAVKIDPITKPKPTNADLARQGNQLHICFEDHRKKTNTEFKAVRGDITSIKEALGLNGGKKKPVVGLSSPWQAFRRTVFATTTSVTALAVAYKLVIFAAPIVWVFLKALDAAIRKGTF